MKKYLWTFILVSLMLAGMVTQAFAGSITVTWDANTEPDLAGYNLYYDTDGVPYDHKIDVGNVTQYTIEGLAPGVYHIACTAYDTSNLESDYSEEAVGEILNLPPGRPGSCIIIEIIND